jgi:hypothetical protein
MATTVKYKDLTTGNIVTVAHDPNYPVTITVSDATTEWELETVDPLHGTNQSSWVGNIPKPKN